MTKLVLVKSVACEAPNALTKKAMKMIMVYLPVYKEINAIVCESV